MSAFLAMAYADRVELLTDGAVYLPDGTLTDIRSKVRTSDRIPLAVTGRGDIAVLDAFMDGICLLASARSFDDTMAALSDVLDTRKAASVPEDCEVVVMGISETRGPVVLYFATFDAGGGVDPWKLHDAGPDLCGGSVVDVSDLDASDSLLGCGVEIFERMRQVPGRNPVKPELPPIFGIGGQIDWTIIAANGAATLCLHVWPDQIGEKIKPGASAEMAA